MRQIGAFLFQRNEKSAEIFCEQRGVKGATPLRGVGSATPHGDRVATGVEGVPPSQVARFAEFWYNLLYQKLLEMFIYVIYTI